jgi:L-aminopeptidase/D-esterase-like protein
VQGVITDVPDILVGHWTGAGTGVTVVLAPPGTTGSGETRGGAPASRETALLEPGKLVEHVDAVVLTGGSAFGLATADGVVRALAERRRGFTTRGGPVPIVPAAAIYDLVASDGEIPGPEEGRMALAAVGDGPLATGRVGAGTGATLGKWRGGEFAVPGGLGSASAVDGEVVVGALVVVNAVGDVIGADGRVLAGSTAPPGSPPFPAPLPFEEKPEEPQVDPGTTLVVVATNARCTKLECRLLAESAHHGLARALHPSHTRHDGDIAIALATGAVDAQVDRLRTTVGDVTAEAVRQPFR